MYQVHKELFKNTEEAIELANQIGYPVIIKATAGGGGKGIRVARHEEELVKGIQIYSKKLVPLLGTLVYT